MKMKRPTRIASFAAALGLTFALGTMCLANRAAKPPAEADVITRLTTNVLERSQFAHHPLDSELAGKFLDSYLDALDGTHSLFTQADVHEFAPYRETLAQATRNAGDTSAAQAIFRRYLQRLGQQVSYATQALKTATFDFVGNDAFSLDREHAERPRDLAAAQALWRQQLRAEYLQAKLADSADRRTSRGS